MTREHEQCHGACLSSLWKLLLYPAPTPPLYLPSPSDSRENAYLVRPGKASFTFYSAWHGRVSQAQLCLHVAHGP